MKRTRAAIAVMLVSFALGLIVSLGSLISTRGRVDSEVFRSTPLFAPAVLVSLLTPWVLVLQIAAVVLIVPESRQAGGLHRRLVLLGVCCFVVWALANAGGFLPLSFMAIQRGSEGLLRAGQMVKAFAAPLNYAVPFLLVFGLARARARAVLSWALTLTIIGNFTTVVLGGLAMRLSVPSAGAGAVPVLSVDYSQGVYPLLLVLGYLGALLYIAAYAAVRAQLRGPGGWSQA